MTTPRLTKSIGQSPSWRCCFVLVPLAFVCFALSPTAKALLPAPSPDGGYPGGNTAEGINALHDVNTAVGINNTAVGLNALTNDTTGPYNVAIGAGALQSNTTGQQNMAVGADALRSNVAGNFNMGIGFRALFMNTGSRNSAVGAAALRNNAGASDNTAIGSNALRENTIGEDNTAIGASALSSNSTGKFNNAVGANSLLPNTDGDSNNALGESALFSNIHASANTAIGDVALANNDSSGAGLGNSNTAVGAGALFSNVDGDSNNAVGFNALGSNIDGLFNNVIGFAAMADNAHGSGNVAVGDSAGAGVEGDFNIYLGSFAGPSAPGPESETIRIGDAFNTACFIGGIRGQTASSGAAVFVDANGKLGTVTSSARFKDDIKPMDKASESVLALKPVTFRYKKGIDPQGIPQFGLVAEEVEKVNPDLVVRDANGAVYTVRYEAVNAMLLNEFLKEHHQVQDLKTIVAKQQKQIEALTAGLQKVSAQLEASKPAPHVVNNP